MLKSIRGIRNDIEHSRPAYLPPAYIRICVYEMHDNRTRMSSQQLHTVGHYNFGGEDGFPIPKEESEIQIHTLSSFLRYTGLGSERRCDSWCWASIASFVAGASRMSFMQRPFSSKRTSVETSSPSIRSIRRLGDTSVRLEANEASAEEVGVTAR